jgi:hypothetical protein
MSGSTDACSSEMLAAFSSIVDARDSIILISVLSASTTTDRAR